MLSRFHLIPERYGRTDGQTDGQTVTIRFHASYNIVLGSDGYLYILSNFGCLPNASLDWPV